MRRRLLAAATTLTVLVPLSLVTSSTSAVADPQTISYSCVGYAVGVDYAPVVDPYTVDAPSPDHVDAGSTVILKWHISVLPASLPVDVTNASITVTPQFEMSRNGGSWVPFSGPTSPATTPADIAAHGALPGPTSLSVPYQVLGSSGDILRIRPAGVTVNFTAGDDGIGGDASITCTPTTEPAVSSTITIGATAPDCVSTNDCTGDQTFVGDVADDALTMADSPESPEENTITGAPVTASSESQTSSTEVDFARISDTRTSAVGWTLSVQMDHPLTGPDGAVIPSSGVRVDQVSCGAPTGATGGAPAAETVGGALNEAVVLCAVDTGALGPTGHAGGQWDAKARLSIDIPGFTKAGTYEGTLTLLLS